MIKAFANEIRFCKRMKSLRDEIFAWRKDEIRPQSGERDATYLWLVPMMFAPKVANDVA